MKDKFIYCVSIYVLWKDGASLLEEKYISTIKPIKKLKKSKIKHKNYNLVQFLDLIYSPDDIKNKS